MFNLTKISDRLHQFASGRTLALSTAFLALVLILLKVLNTPFGVMRIKKVSGGIRILDMQGAYTPDQAYATLEALGEAGRQAYVNFLVLGDVLLPLAYAAFLATALSLGIRGVLLDRPHWSRKLNLLPLLAALLDLLENTAILGLLWTYPERADGLATVAGALTGAKRAVLMISLWGTLFVFAVWGALSIWRWRNGKQSASK